MTFIDRAHRERRTMEHALADLRSEYKRRPSPELAEKIRVLEAEIARRKQVSEEKSS